MGDVKNAIANLSPEKRKMLEQRLLERRGSSSNQVIRRRQPTDPELLSFNQQQLWFLDQLSPQTAAYTVPIPMRILDALDVDALVNAFRAVMERHTALRTVFRADATGTPRPVVLPEWTGFRCLELAGESSDPISDRVFQILKDEVARPFDLAADPMVRALLIRFSEKDHILLITAHHIAWDAWTKIIVFRELSHYYRGYCRNRVESLAELPIQYSDFAFWQRTWLQGPVLENQLGYWTKQLGGAPPRLELRPDKQRPASPSLRGAKYPAVLDPELLKAAREASRGQSTTVFMTLLSAYYALLYYFTGQEDILVASPFAARTRIETEQLGGFFINTMVLRTKISGDLTYKELVARVRDTTVGAHTHQELPFDKLVEAIRPPRDLSRMPLTQVNFRVQNDPTPVPVLDGATIIPLPFIDNFTSKFDFALELSAVEGGLGFFEYSTDLWHESTIAMLWNGYTGVLADLIAHPETSLDALTARSLVPTRRRTTMGLRDRSRAIASQIATGS